MPGTNTLAYEESLYIAAEKGFVKLAQVDLMIEKNAQFFEKVAQTIAEPKNAKSSTSKLNLKV